MQFIPTTTVLTGDPAYKHIYIYINKKLSCAELVTIGASACACISAGT